MKVLFLCVANSARSQLAEGMAKLLWGQEVQVISAGSKPAQVNPFAAQALNEVGYDPSAHYSKSVFELPQEHVESLDYVITLCAEEVCPVFLSAAKKLHWPLPDPAGRGGTDDEQLARFRETREAIRKRLGEFAREVLEKA